MVEVWTLKKSIDKPPKKDYKDNKCQKDILADLMSEEVPPPVATKKEITDAIRLFEGGLRKLKKSLKRLSNRA